MKRIGAWILALLMVASCVPATALTAYATPDYTVSQECVIADSTPGDEEELLDGYAYQLFYGNAVTYGRKAGDRLTGNTKILYDALVPLIRQLASGERTTTVIGVGRTVETAQGLYQADVEATFSGSDFDARMLLDALLTDLPYELYWYDKTASTMFWSISGEDLEHVRIELPVSENYRGEETYSVDCKKARAAAAAAANSAAIVTKYAADTDYEKLLGYKDEICYLVEYDTQAALGGSYSQDNDPWQLIHVFDGDETTNVVCEGYSKAFSYLCRQSAFEGDVTCITVSGQMGGAHMWNIVTLEGQNYLVDVTNSDGGAVGYDGSLFLAGGTGSIAEGYWVGDQYYEYVKYIGGDAYYSDDVILWGDGPDSILCLAAENYLPKDAQVIASGMCNEAISWSLDEKGVLTLSGSGDIPNYAPGGAPWYGEYKDRIEKVVLKEGIGYVGAYAFAALPNLTRATFAETVVRLETGAFQNCTSLMDVFLPVSLMGIAPYVFAGCTALERITIPMCVLGIGDYAFYGCTALRRINIPLQVQASNLTAYAFEGCDSLEAIQAEDDCYYFCSDAAGALYNKDKTKLIKVPGGATGHFVIPDTVTAVDPAAFSGCDGLTAVTIPVGVNTVGEHAFRGCSGLKDVYYAGTGSQWDQIQIAQGNEALTDGTLHSVDCQNHRMVQHPAQTPTCTEPGWNAYEACAACGHSNYQEIPAKGHNLYLYAGQAATCTEPGWEPYGICEYCDYTTYQQIPATGHRVVAHAAKAPSCTEYGWDAYETCQVCAYSTYVQIPAPGHSYEDIICTVCGTQAAVLDSGSCGSQLSWQYRDGGILEISGSGDMVDYDGRGAVPWMDYSSQIKAVFIREGVTSIGNYAFSQCRAMAVAEIAGTVNRIGNDAFLDCDGLTALVLSDAITQVGDYSFCDCSNLESVTFGSRVEKIGRAAFGSCPKLSKYRVSTANATFSSDDRGVLFNKTKTVLLRAPNGITGSYTIPSGVVSVDDSAFSECVGLTGVTVPESLTDIAATVFDDCSSMTYNLHNGIRYLGTAENPYHLLLKSATDTLVELQPHADTKRIADEAFYDYKSLVTATIPGSVESIGVSAFSGCTGLETLILENGVGQIGDYAFSTCSGLTALIIPDSVTVIGDHAFSGCSGLTAVDMGKGVQTIEEFAFSFCMELKSITIGEGVSVIEKRGFYYCPNLSAVTIPTNVTSIGEDMFGYCGNLQDVYYWGSAKQWAQIRIAANNNWVSTVNLHFGAGHTHSFEDFVCTVCGCNAVDLELTGVTLRPGCAGLYYEAAFDVAAGVEVKRTGIALSVYTQKPVADDSDPLSLWTEGNTSVLVTNILDTDQDRTANDSRAAMPIYARAYAQLADGTYIYGDVVAMSLQQLVRSADNGWNTLDSTQKAELSAMYSKFHGVMRNWGLPNLMSNISE